ncbi:uncharacterized protein BO95DRAFT_432281 [Aspergillus brunneoviolaceus CBS 621.78]|uniref:Uncharacterized protein n=1 Tax=Aspergillus brunneoviolaceus CBS 621.78 TaxID=1450534 RepID=A0ACD1G864_9EURO|nr:hypothetical protein BO95DRAFT_432281 [Aspergillus brunneoviolaceus CBS 621.78]RAH45316.1 hypothetical protein BO95DRAFT_432281 [Aspergillus brunneoviolaceus CBS 621.78]
MQTLNTWDSRDKTMGKWAIFIFHEDGEEHYWCYGDGGSAGDFPTRAGLYATEHYACIDTWSRDFHVYKTSISKEEAESILGSGNVWPFSGSDEEYKEELHKFWKATSF